MKSVFQRSALILACGLSLYSCSSHEIVESTNQSKVQPSTSQLTKHELKEEFARALSSVVSQRQDVRELLKTEALKQFDKNYDILWAEVRDAQVGGQSLRELLVAQSSEALIQEVEQSVPLLNILFPSIFMFNATPESYDSADVELPVALPSKDANLLFFDGVLTDSLTKGEVPGFHVLVVNENERVEVDPLYSLRATTGRRYRFLDDAYDGTKDALRSAENEPFVGERAVQAFKYFNKNDNSEYSRALQRDYIYYGMTPENRTGKLNLNASEYIGFIEVSPLTFYSISDDVPEEGEQRRNEHDPNIMHEEVYRKKVDFTEDELVDAMWTKGAYSIVFEIAKSNNSVIYAKKIPARPEQLWKFNHKRYYRHSTWIRSSKYTYTINPRDFTIKRFYVDKTLVPLDKWDLSEESPTRYVSIYEYDGRKEIETKLTVEFSKVDQSKFSGGIKLGLGLGKGDSKADLNTDLNAEVQAGRTERVVKEFTIKRMQESDALGNATIYFYDPIIKREISQGVYEYQTYSTGMITFGIFSN